MKKGKSETKKEAAETKRIDPNQYPILLSQKFSADFFQCFSAFPQSHKLELIEHILDCFDLIDVYLNEPTKLNYEPYKLKEDAFLKVHKGLLKPYVQLKMFLYFGSDIVLIEKEVLTKENYNSSATQEQSLSYEQWQLFFTLCRNLLYFEKKTCLLNQSPDYSLTGVESNVEQPFKRGRSAMRRDASDNWTVLNVEETVSFIHYLQKTKVFLKEEYLSDKDASLAFEILTGYSRNTIRVKLGQIHHEHSFAHGKTLIKQLENVIQLINESLKH
jgi:hypothetical protein